MTWKTGERAAMGGPQNLHHSANDNDGIETPPSPQDSCPYDPFKGSSHSMEQDYQTEKEVFERLKRDISLRLSDVCSELSEADKAAIVDRITRNQGSVP
jgi:hypothetical protein